METLALTEMYQTTFHAKMQPAKAQQPYSRGNTGAALKLHSNAAQQHHERAGEKDGEAAFQHMSM